jgi:glycine/D-amino acid oxidase-like deaminating enzyme
MMPNRSTDVVVIGGGVVGTAVAYFLARKNIDVILVEKGAITAGTSGRGESATRRPGSTAA